MPAVQPASVPASAAAVLPAQSGNSGPGFVSDGPTELPWLPTPLDLKIHIHVHLHVYIQCILYMHIIHCIYVMYIH